MARKLLETDLYPPVKRFLEAQGYEVKAEVGKCDVMAVRGSEPPVIVELKLAFNLPLIHQAIDRQAITDHVYVAVPMPEKGIPRSDLMLCKRLGIGLLTVREQWVEPHLDPVPYTPRKHAKRSQTLLKEFYQRVGDSNSGGSTRRKLMTAYRQDALRCASYIDAQRSARVCDVASMAQVARAPGILRSNVYRWFTKIERGTYELTNEGRQALIIYRDVLRVIVKPASD